MKNKTTRIRDYIIDELLDCAKKLKFQFSKQIRDELITNKKYRGYFGGKRCFILGNGPSLKKYDLSVLKNEVVYCVNEFYRSNLLDVVKPNFYFLADPAYFQLDKNVPESRQFIGAMNNILDNGIELWAPYFFRKNIEIEYGSNDHIHYFFNNLSSISLIKKSISFDKCIPQMQAVIQYAILHAVYSGFKTIYLLGVEQSDIFSVVESYRNAETEYDYAFSLSDDAKRWKLSQTREYSLSDMLYGYARIFELYDLLSGYCKRNDVEILNCSPGSLICSIESFDWNNISWNKKM